jgi:LysR family transcriptional regulator, regulator for genes of the gallate degradation pathway
MIPLRTLSLHVPRLMHLVEIIEHRSINKAAGALNMSQSALSRSIHLLEKSLGVPLLERSARGVGPTAYGELLLIHARTIRANLGQTLADIHAIAGNRQGEIRIGATMAASTLMGHATERLQATHPRVFVRSIETSTTDLVALVRIGELDLAIAPSSEVPEPDVIEERLLTQDFHLWVRPAHPLLRRRGLTLEDLSSQAWIIPQRESSLRRRLDMELRKADISLSGPITETSSLHLVRGLLIRSDRIALLARTVLSMEERAGLVKILKGRWSFPPRSYSYYVRQRRSPTPALRALIQHIKAICTENGSVRAP